MDTPTPLTSSGRLTALFGGVAAGSFNEALIHALISFFRAIVESPKPLVEWNESEPVITFEVFMMKVVKMVVGSYRCIPSQDYSLKARMPDARRQRRVYALEYDNKRVGRNDVVDKHTRVEENLFYRMHC